VEKPTKGTREWRIGPFTAVQVADDGKVWVTRQSLLSGNIETREIPTYHPQTIAKWLEGRARGIRNKMVHEEFPDLNNEDREFLLTGITPSEWANAFPPEQGDDE
jgi:hypothetical protein